MKAEDRKRVLVVNPPNVPFSDPSLLMEPLDALTLAGVAQRRGCRVSVMDMDRDALGLAAFRTAIECHRPDIVVIPYDYHTPLYTSDSAARARQLCEMAAELDCLVLIGGRPVSYYPRLFVTCKNVLAATGDMEPVLESLLAGNGRFSIKDLEGIVYKDGDSLYGTKPAVKRYSMDLMPRPARELVDRSKYIDVRPIITARGCVQNCSFCPVRPYWGNWRAREAENVANEIEEMVSAGARKILFLDDNALVDKPRMWEICKRLIRRRVQALCGCLATPSSYDPGTFELMYQAGFRWIHFGAESGSQRILDSLCKRSTVSLIRQAILGSKSLGFRVRTSWILDAPGSTVEDIDATADLILATEPHEIRAHFLAYRAGAPLAEKGRGRLDPSELPEQFLHLSRPGSFSGPLPTSIIEAKTGALTEALGTRGYQTVWDGSQWAGIATGRRDSLKFISFCASRYGLGWEAL